MSCNNIENHLWLGPSTTVLEANGTRRPEFITNFKRHCILLSSLHCKSWEFSEIPSRTEDE